MGSGQASQPTSDDGNRGIADVVQCSVSGGCTVKVDQFTRNERATVSSVIAIGIVDEHEF